MRPAERPTGEQAGTLRAPSTTTAATRLPRIALVKHMGHLVVAVAISVVSAASSRTSRTTSSATGRWVSEPPAADRGEPAGAYRLCPKRPYPLTQPDERRGAPGRGLERKPRPFVGRRVGAHRSDFLRRSLRHEGATGLGSRQLRCALGSHEYSFGGIMLGNRLDRCLDCGKVRLRPTARPGSVHRLPTGRRQERTRSLM